MKGFSGRCCADAKRALAVSAFLSFTASLTAATITISESGVSGERVEIEGWLSPGERREQSFVLVNNTNGETLDLKLLPTGCSCLSFDVESATLKPNEKIRITGQFIGVETPGTYVTSATIAYASNAVKKSLEIQFVGKVGEFITAPQSQGMTWGTLTAKSSEVEALESHEIGVIELVRGNYPSVFVEVKASIEPNEIYSGLGLAIFAKDNNSWLMTLRQKKEIPMGELVVPITVSLIDGVEKQIKIKKKVILRIIGEVRAVPARVLVKSSDHTVGDLQIYGFKLQTFDGRQSVKISHVRFYEEGELAPDVTAISKGNEVYMGFGSAGNISRLKNKNLFIVTDFIDERGFPKAISTPVYIF